MNRTDAAYPLSGNTIVITRPVRQSEALKQALTARGAQVLLFPVIDIAPLNDSTDLRDLASRLADYHIAFFVSPNAVDYAFTVLGNVTWPMHLEVAAMGPSTAMALRERGFANVIIPDERFDSEAVLALPAFNASVIRDRRIVLLRGDSGRDLLVETLRARGAAVDLVACYRRQRAHTNPAQLIAKQAQGQLDALIFTSSEGARYFAEIVGEATAKMLAELPCFAPHARIVEQLRVLGAQQVHTTAPGDDGIVAALVRHFG